MPHFKKILNSLSRTTSSTKFIPEIDGLRFIAIFAVIIHHISSYAMVYSPYVGEVSQFYHRHFLDFGSHGVSLFLLSAALFWPYLLLNLIC